MKTLKNFTLITAMIACGVLVSCSDDDNNPQPEPSLYTRLGGTTMVSDPNSPGTMIEQGRLSYRSVVDSTIVLIVADIQTAAPGNFGQHFAPLVAEVTAGNTTNLAELSKNLTDFFSANTGGGATRSVVR